MNNPIILNSVVFSYALIINKSEFGQRKEKLSTEISFAVVKIVTKVEAIMIGGRRHLRRHGEHALPTQGKNRRNSPKSKS